MALEQTTTDGHHQGKPAAQLHHLVDERVIRRAERWRRCRLEEQCGCVIGAEEPQLKGTSCTAATNPGGGTYSSQEPGRGQE